MAGNSGVTNPRLTIPTGFESQQRAIERRRAIAEAMLSRGLAPQDGMRNWTQLLGQMAQAWAGKSGLRGADRQQERLDTNIRDSYSGKLTAFAVDERALRNNQMTLQEFLQKYRGDPMLENALEPYVKAYEANQTADQRRDPTIVTDPATGRSTTMNVSDAGNFSPVAGGFQLPNTNVRDVNGVAVDMGSAVPGSVLPQDPTAMIIRDNQRNFIPNAPAINATRLSQGFGGTTGSMQDPGTAGGQPALIDDAILRSLSPENQASIPSGSSLAPPSTPQVSIVNGVTYYIINGKIYDNPEGR